MTVAPLCLERPVRPSSTVPASRARQQDGLADRIVCGDCRDVLPKLPAGSVDFVLTDPPYLVRFRSRDGRQILGDTGGDWLVPAFREIYRVLKHDRFCLSFYGFYSAERFLAAWREVGFSLEGHFVFVKGYPSGRAFTQRFHENAYLLTKGRPRLLSSPPADVVRFRYTGNRLHPTQKPVEALLPLVKSFSHPGNLVLDPFAGSGTTGVAARRLGRRYLLIETDPGHCASARERLRAGAV